VSGLAPGWVEATLGELGVEAQSGFPSGKHNATGRGVPHLRPMNVDRLGRIDLGEIKYVEDDRDRRLRAGDVLFNNTNSPALIGKTAYFDKAGDFAFSNHMTRLRAPDVVEGKYLAAYLHTLWMHGVFRRLCNHHVNQASVSSKRLLGELVLALPPLNEQRRIVAAIEEHLSRLDAGEAALETGLRRLEVFGEAADSELYRGWDAKPLGSICPVFVDCPHRTPSYGAEGIPALRPRDVVRGRLRLDTAARVDRSEFEIQTVRRVPTEGDVVYSRELSFGWAVVVPPGAELCLSQGMVIFRPDDSMLPEFLASVLNSAVGRGQAKAAATGSAHPHINLRDIREYDIPVPPLSEQRRIVAEVEERLSKIDAMRASIERAQRRSQTLRSAILKRAFRGELVPQDPADEPAEALVAHIRAERDTAAPGLGHRRVRA